MSELHYQDATAATLRQVMNESGPVIKARFVGRPRWLETCRCVAVLLGRSDAVRGGHDHNVHDPVESNRKVPRYTRRSRGEQSL
jgi:hypothetical protein